MLDEWFSVVVIMLIIPDVLICDCGEGVNDILAIRLLVSDTVKYVNI